MLSVSTGEESDYDTTNTFLIVSNRTVTDFDLFSHLPSYNILRGSRMGTEISLKGASSRFAHLDEFGQNF